jgi:16S rRNA (uracil1498-N3)-methyltransferase
MECLYAPELDHSTTVVTIEAEEFTHARALRLREGDIFLCSNGRGLCAEARVAATKRNNLTAHVQRLLPYHNEPRVDHHAVFGLALGILDNRDRMEFAIEKATELGITDFMPLLTERSQHHRIHSDRLCAKALAAMKQSQRSRLPRIHSPMTVQQCAEYCTLEQQSYLIGTDANGTEPQVLPADVTTRGVWIVVGPEGGFSEREYQILQQHATLWWSLGAARLRAETAAIVSVGLTTILVPQKCDGG